jgi:hypothetical protein
MRRILIIVALVAFGAGYSIKKTTVKTVTREVIAETHVAVCAPLLVPQANKKHVKKQQDILAAVIPASALR